MSQVKIFARLTKFDEKSGEFEGVATDETTDLANEALDYDGSKPYFQEWSGRIAKATDGASVGNLRAMHGNVVAGKFTGIEFDDVAKAIRVKGVVVDANEKVKAAKGCYTGLSIGGDYVSKKEHPARRGVTSYVAKPTEISLVDVGCNPAATFAYTKADGSVELRKFAPAGDNVPAPAEDVTPEQIAAMEAEVATTTNPVLKAAIQGVLKKLAPPKAPEPTPTGPAYLGKALDTAITIRASWAHINKAENAAKLGDKLVETRAMVAKAWAEKIDAAGPPSAAKTEAPANVEKAAAIDCAASVLVERAAKDEKIAKQLQALGKFYGQPLEKGLWTVACLAEILASLDCVIDDTTYEADYEEDDSTVPAQLRAAAASVGLVLMAMAREEVEEAFGTAGDSTMALSAKAVMTKFATRRQDAGSTLEKRAVAAEAKVTELEKAATASGERIKLLEKDIGEGHALMLKAAETIDEQKRALTKIMGEPTAKKPAMFALGKADDALPLPGEKPAEEVIYKADGTKDEVRMALKKSLSRPIVQG